MTQIYDAGAFVALERNDRHMWRRLNRALADGEPPRTHGGVVAQVWRGGSGRQALLARALRGVEVVALDETLGRRAGMMLARARMTDAIDAAVVALASNGDRIYTSDSANVSDLIAVTHRRVDVVSV